VYIMLSPPIKRVILYFAVVSQRAVHEIDVEKAKQKPNISNVAQLMKDGHDGLLTTAFCSHTDDLTTHLNSYRPRQVPPVRQKGTLVVVLYESYKLYLKLLLIS